MSGRQCKRFWPGSWTERNGPGFVLAVPLIEVAGLTRRLPDNELGVQCSGGFDRFQDIDHVAWRDTKGIEAGDNL